MKYILREMNKDSLPREKIIKYGINSLSDYELLAVILKTGIKGKSVLDLSIEIIEYFKSFNSINDITLNELKMFKGIGEAKALEILSCIELGKRLLSFKPDKLILKDSLDIYLYIKNELVNLKKEELICLYVDIRYKLLAKRVICVGNLTSVSVDFKDAIKWAFKYSCFGMIFIHNHPSGEPIPSNEDKVMTNLIINKLSNLDIEFVDHIIVGRDAYYSFKKSKLIRLN